MRNKHYIFLLIFGLLISSCLKDEYILTKEETTYPVTITYVRSSLQGIVYGKAGIPLSGVEVRIGTNYQQTNDQGRYYFSDIPMAQEGDVVRFNKGGHVESYAFIKPVLNDLMTLSSSMVAPTSTYKFSNKDIILIPIGLDGKIEIPANAFQYEDGSVNTTDFIVESIFYENICNANCYPVNLDISTSDQQRLKTDMIIGLNVISTSGDKLILKDDYDMTVIFPSNHRLTYDMELYQYNTSSLRWSKNKFAIIESKSKYILNEIPDFISVGQSKKYAWIYGDIIDNYGNQHIKNYGIATVGKDRAVFDHARTSSSGKIQIAWPINEPFSLWIDNECNIPVQAISCLATTENSHDLGIIDLGLNNNSTVIKGSVFNANKQTVQVGLVKIIPQFGDPYYADVDSSTGHYYTHIRGCGFKDYTLKCYNLDEMNFQELHTSIRANGRKTINCITTQKMENYLVINYDDNIYVLDQPEYKFEGNKIWLTYHPDLDNLQEALVTLSMPFSSIGTSSSGSLSFLSFDQNKCELFYDANINNGNAEFIISAVPDSISNSFKGEVLIKNYLDESGNSHNLSVKFDITL